MSVPPGMTAQRFLEETGPYPRVAPVDQPAPTDMPLRLEVLGALADDAEPVYTMRNCGNVKSYGLALVGENVLLSMLRDLIDDGLIEAESEYLIVDDKLIEREPDLPLATSDDDLKRYWLVMTRAGWAEWEAGAEQISAYHAAHPLHAEDKWLVSTARSRRQPRCHRSCCMRPGGVSAARWVRPRLPVRVIRRAKRQ
jgi:hypothetical protein